MRALVFGLLVACKVPDVHFHAGDGGGDDSAIDTTSADAAAPGSYIWVRSLSAALPTGVIVNTSGIVVTAYLYNTADLGGAQLTSAGGSDMVIASFAEADAAHLYSVRHGDIGNEFPFIDTLDTTGTPVVDGVTYMTPVDVGQGPVTGGGGTGADGYIGRYTAGSASWVQRIVGPGEDKILFAATAGSEVYGAGWFEQTTNWNGGQLTSLGGRDLFLTRISTFGGTVDLTKQYGSTGRDEFSGIAVQGANLITAGFYDDAIDFGNNVGVTASAGGLDFFVAKLDSNGVGIWARTFGGPGDDRDVKVVLDTKGDIYITGSYTTSITLDSFNLTSQGLSDLFIAKLSGTDGTVLWADSLGSVNAENAGRIAVDNNGHVALGASVNGPIENMTSNGGVDAIVAEFDATTGLRQWLKLYSTTGDDRGGAVGYGTTGALYAAFSLGGAFDFGVPIIGAPDPLGVLVRFAP